MDLTRNGGLISYFHDSGADKLPDCLRALDILGASGVRACVERVSALFGENVPVSIEERNTIMDSWPGDDEKRCQLLDDVDDQLDPLLEELELKLAAYLRKHGLTTWQSAPRNVTHPRDERV